VQPEVIRSEERRLGVLQKATCTGSLGGDTSTTRRMTSRWPLVEMALSDLPPNAGVRGRRRTRLGVPRA
jgi:hypothetical protein